MALGTPLPEKLPLDRQPPQRLPEGKRAPRPELHHKAVPERLPERKSALLPRAQHERAVAPVLAVSGQRMCERVRLLAAELVK